MEHPQVICLTGVTSSECLRRDVICSPSFASLSWTEWQRLSQGISDNVVRRLPIRLGRNCSGIDKYMTHHLPVRLGRNGSGDAKLSVNISFTIRQSVSDGTAVVKQQY
jgi:hypothetical protein